MTPWPTGRNVSLSPVATTAEAPDPKGATSAGTGSRKPKWSGQSQRFRPSFGRMASPEVEHSADRLHTALESLATKKPVQPHAVEINRLENEADRAYHRAIESLFETERDPIMVLKWKELLDSLEEITDACEDVANVIEGVVVKHG